ncbi:MAG: 2-oxoacid:acceptor oxidoreductase subunit alpha [Desulfonatronovibrionaceae bacterium]
MRHELNILIGGEAGQGLVTVGELLARALVRSGYYIHVTQSYMSRIRGGHNTFSVRTGTAEVPGPTRGIDILVALNRETIELHEQDLKKAAAVLKDRDLDYQDLKTYNIPFKDLTPGPLYENVAALGYIGAVLGLKQDILQGCITSLFGKKKPDLVQKNIQVLDAAYEAGGTSGLSGFELEAAVKGPGLMMTANDAAVLGALTAGVNFCAYYPMTPATAIPMSLNTRGYDLGVVVEQAEDEIAAINMAIGASYAGARAMVATSGGGFALMCEGVSLAGMTETPVVIIVGQRPGPATGLPTRTEQADLNLVVYAGHGEFPRAVFAPANPEQTFELTVKAFDLAEKSQGPVFLLTDQYMADSYRRVESLDLSAGDNPVLPGDSWPQAETYQRYALTSSGVSPRLVPTTGSYLVVLDSDEHYQDGHITEDLKVRVKMNNKRLSKEKVLEEDIVPPEYFGPENPAQLLICWGSTLGPALEAMRLSGKNDLGVLHFSQVWPLNEDHFQEITADAFRVIFVESNATAQFAGLLQSKVCPVQRDFILRYDGLPMDAEYILDRL